MNKLRVLTVDEMEKLPALHKTNPYLKKIVEMESLMFAIRLRKRYADPSEWDDLDEEIAKAEFEQRVQWNFFVMSWDGNGMENNG